MALGLFVSMHLFADLGKWKITPQKVGAFGGDLEHPQ